ncbi:MAG TPA: glycosyltransferase family 39 protein [Patescibacteria group bacterium]|nr:glycosyltransferase family 39 protein [Patescibacteria group bacterium]
MKTDRWLIATIAFSILASLVSFAYIFHQHEVTTFADARSRLIIARGVVDSLNPGIEQTGAPWLPTQLLATAMTAKINFMYKSGLSGALVSMISFVCMSYFSYKLSRLVFEDSAAAFIGVIAMAGPNVLYMQAVPMAEVPFLAFLSGSFYYLARFLYKKEAGNFLAGIFLAGAMMTRYEGWIIFFAFSAIVGISIWRQKESTLAEVIFWMTRFALCPIVVVLVWFIYNQAILGDWLYWYHGQYAAAAYAGAAGSGNLTTAGKPFLSLETFGLTTLDSLGYIVSALTVLGVLSFAFFKTQGMVKILAFSLLLPFPIFVLLTYQGGSVVILHPVLMRGANWGTRYGITMCLSASFFVGYLAHFSRRLRIQALLVPLIVASFVFTIHTGVISYKEATESKSGEQAAILRTAGDWLATHYDGGHILMQRGNNTDAFYELTKNIKSRHVVHEGNRDYWKDSFKNPVGNRWIFMKEAGSDAIYGKYENSPVIEDRYTLVFQAPGVKIYQLKEMEALSGK